MPGRNLSIVVVASFPGRSLLWIVMLLAIAVGCEEQSSSGIQLTATAVRSSRRAYDGAPPVVGHASFGIDCTTCHTDRGRAVPTVGFAPANPHALVSYTDSTQNCRQCHLFAQTDDLFAESTFAGMPQVITAADRMYEGAPPVIPHRVFMRENCSACHDGPAARPEIRCTHPERTNCRQCHVQR